MPGSLQSGCECRRQVPARANVNGREPTGMEVARVREAAEPATAVVAKARCRVATTYSRRHIDLQRVAAALCPAYQRIAA
ncbi:putative leader peptide [Kitasatospora sp. NBC_01266]|uniref:putative leader peptide n=1 Tax=Kitasatospora sp. NBC_01266 TaxID=2903572 RepID=UPI003FA58EB4